MMYDRSSCESRRTKPGNRQRSWWSQGWAEGNVGQQSTGRVQYRETVSQALKRVRHVATILRSAVTYPRWEKLWGRRRRSWHFHRPY